MISTSSLELSVVSHQLWAISREPSVVSYQSWAISREPLVVSQEVLFLCGGMQHGRWGAFGVDAELVALGHDEQNFLWWPLLKIW